LSGELRHGPSRLTRLGAAALSLVAFAVFAATAQATPIKHVVVIYQENHSFDNVLGRLCPRLRCDGATTGLLPDGSRIPLQKAADIVPNVPHESRAQRTAIDGGRMDGFAKLAGCGAATHYQCMTQFMPSQIPNLASLATHFGVSDRTFELSAIPSWGAHLELVAAKLDGFTGDNPSGGSGPGWGCDSKKDADWRATPSSPIQREPSCIPDYNLDSTLFPFGGTYRSTPVKPIATIMDELDNAGLSWRFYSSANSSDGGYSWATCPTFAECLYTHQRTNMVARSNVLADAQAGDLPALSLVLPNGSLSQHNSNSMAQGDNWIGQVVSSIEQGPDWSSTAIFITYDDCGCFYDHVAPPAGLGIRVPMVIVSPYAKPAFVDSNRASFASLLAFTEHTFGLSPLGTSDANAYDYSNAFDFTQKPNPRVAMTKTTISAQEQQRLQTMPHPEDGT
jgi:phospholipase C